MRRLPTHLAVQGRRDGASIDSRRQCFQKGQGDQTQFSKLIIPHDVSPSPAGFSAPAARGILPNFQKIALVFLHLGPPTRVKVCN